MSTRYLAIAGVALASWLLVASTHPCIAGDEPERPRPFDYQQVYNLPVGYFMITTNLYVPAYMQNNPTVVYLWANVALPLNNIPDLGTMHARPLFDFHYLRKPTTVYQIIPQIYYLPQGSTCEIGYYDWAHQYFYRWKGVQYERENIPEEYKSRDIARKPNTVRIVDIDAPGETLQNYFKYGVNHKSHNEKGIQQSVPAYPPQGVGSAEP